MPGLHVVLLEVMRVSGKGSRGAFRLHRVLKLTVRRSQHFQQIRHPRPTHDLGPNL